jgi:hypothetical protein
MGLKLKVTTSEGYVRAVSGLFITKGNPSGLTKREVEMVAKLMKHSVKGVITSKTRDKVTDEMGWKKQNFYNMVVILKAKGVLIDEELNRIFTAGAINLEYAAKS